MTDKILTIDGFRAAAKEADEGKAPDATLRASFETKAVPSGERSMDFIISTGAMDRESDSLNVNGWELANYRKNPVVLFAHDYKTLPLAKARNIRVEDGALKATADFTPEGMAKFNDIVFDMLKGGFLNATSVGFRPIKWSWRDDDNGFGIDFEKQELLEFSIVPVPCNQECLVEARAAGIDTAPIDAWAKGWLGMDADSVVLTKAALAEMEAAAKPLAPVEIVREVTVDRIKGRLTGRAIELARLKRA
jgi:HK97 family phage prohead protease